MVTSTDVNHTTWTAITPPVFTPQQALYSVAWTGSQFVAVGAYGNAVTSPDGISWTLRNTGSATDGFAGVAGTATQIVAVGPVGYLRTSQ
jgi:hypothetical protein